MSTLTISNDSIEQLCKKIAELVLQNISTSSSPKEPQKNDDLITRQEAIEFLDISEVTIYNWTKKGKLKSYSIGRRKYYKKSEIIEAVTKRKTFNKEGYYEL